jgi:hypothetical protein
METKNKLNLHNHIKLFSPHISTTTFKWLPTDLVLLYTVDCYFLSTIKKDNISPIVPLVLPFNENNTNRTLPKVKWIAISLPTLFPQKDTDFI